MAGPDWADTDAARAWLGKRYPVANARTGSPLLQYLKDEQAKGNKTKECELHLSTGPGGEFRKWLSEIKDDSFIRYTANDMRSVYYPDFVDPVSPCSSHEKDNLRGEASDSSRNLAFGPPAVNPSDADLIGQWKSRQKTTKRVRQPVKAEGKQMQKDWLRTLRPRRDRKPRKTGRTN